MTTLNISLYFLFLINNTHHDRLVDSKYYRKPTVLVRILNFYIGIPIYQSDRLYQRYDEMGSNKDFHIAPRFREWVSIPATT